MSDDGILSRGSVNIPMEEFVFQQVEIYKKEASYYNVFDDDIEYDEEWIFHIDKVTNIHTRKTDAYNGLGIHLSYNIQYITSSMGEGLMNLHRNECVPCNMGQYTYVMDDRITYNNKVRHEYCHVVLKSLQDCMVNIISYSTSWKYNSYVNIKEIIDLRKDNSNKLLIENTNYFKICSFYNSYVAGDFYRGVYIYSIRYV